ncbi:hypothetical protein [Methylobacterium trifolii]|uniref:HEPN AbiU2-like domain-containing protein n=1 Tax=Methylobacterium trifolii TaxID=1003092 RepID=A0ABQ4U2F0_9HYPH|nr:hypothetical protein [Methylobacterium trifolii]GJE60285.1 hypothetical protein MPOCJGCO_2396 [Methylobacterium trifolii]
MTDQDEFSFKINQEFGNVEIVGDFNAYIRSRATGLTTRLTDEQWQILYLLSGANYDHRCHVDVLIDLYRAEVSARGPFRSPHRPAERRQHLQNLSRSIDKFQAELRTYLMPNKLAVSLQWDDDRLYEIIQEIGHLQSHVDKKFHRSIKTGPDSRFMINLVEGLADIWNLSTGLPVSMSKKPTERSGTWNALRFVIAASEIADPNLKLQQDRVANVLKTALARKARKVASKSES